MWVKMGVFVVVIVTSGLVFGEIKAAAGELLVPTAAGKTMRTRRRPFLIILIIILVCQILGETRAAAAIKITCRLLIPIAGDGQRSSQAVLTITRAVVRVECEKEIFQPLNEFATPKQDRLNIDASELVRIVIDEDEKKIYLRVENSFVSRYRNILNLETRHVGYDLVSYGHLFAEFWAIIFAYEKPLHLSDLKNGVR